MAVSKLWSVTSRLGQVIDYAANPEKTAADIYTEEQYQALRDVLSYAKDEEKPSVSFRRGYQLQPCDRKRPVYICKKAYGKDDGIQAYHGYLSFKEQDISPELAQKIGMEFANEVWGKRFQVVVTTHLNTKHLHCHYVINSVSFVDGKRLWGDEKRGSSFVWLPTAFVKSTDCITIRTQTAVSNPLITTSRNKPVCRADIQ